MSFQCYCTTTEPEAEDPEEEEEGDEAFEAGDEHPEV